MMILIIRIKLIQSTELLPSRNKKVNDDKTSNNIQNEDTANTVFLGNKINKNGTIIPKKFKGKLIRKIIVNEL